MTSLEMVDYINAQREPGAAELMHSDFLKKAVLVLKGLAGNFSGYYTASNGKRQPLYNFPKREACLMAMSYSYDLQAKVFDRMTALEAAGAPSAHAIHAPTSLREALMLALAQEEQLEAQSVAKVALEYVVEFVVFSTDTTPNTIYKSMTYGVNFDPLSPVEGTNSYSPRMIANPY